MAVYDTVVEALNGLKAEGYSTNFNIAFDRIICSEKKNILKPDQFEITQVFRFEGDTNPSDEDVVYAIESKDGKLKGVLTSAFGTYADDVSADLLQKLSMHK